MSQHIIQCIQNYIAVNYSGGLIGISDLAEYCNKSEGDIYVGLISLEKKGDIEVVRRYFCPQGHLIEKYQVPYCESCDYAYSHLYIVQCIYVKPLNFSLAQTL
jgi:hypothetical protein